MGMDNLERSEAEERAAALHDIAYEVELDIASAADAGTFRSSTTVTFGSKTEATFIDLACSGLRGVELNGARVDAAIDGSRLSLQGLQERNRLRVDADCEYANTGMGLHRSVDPEDGNIYLHSQCEPFEAHRLFACFDQPDLKASFRITVRAPRAWTVVSNAPVESRTDDGDAVVIHFATTQQLPPYLIAVVAGPYHEATDRHGELQLGLYCRQSLARYLEAGEFFAITKAGLDFFADFFGWPYPFEKYDQLIVPEFNAGAMENPGAITFSEHTIFRGQVPLSVRSWRATTILHEMAHMWFGDLVTMRWWDDLWLNESFATFMALLAQVEVTRYTSGWVDFANGDKNRAARQDQLPTTHPIATVVPDVNFGRLNFDGISYEKGAAVLRQLVAWVGLDGFREGVRAYFDAHSWSNATLADFLAALEKASGRDLRSWSKEWLETAGMNVLRAEVDADAGRIAQLTVLQSAASPEHPTLRSHRIGIGLYRNDGEHLRRDQSIEVDIVGERTVVAQLAGVEIPDLILPNEGDLSFAKLRLDERSITTLIRSLSDIDDPLARALCWGAAWDMTRDAEVAASDFVEIIVRHATRETEATAVDDAVGYAIAAIENYCSAGHRDAVRDRLAEAAWTALQSAPPASDLQQSWATCVVATAKQPRQLERLYGLLDGSVVVEGLTVDQDLRWSLLRRLSARGAASEADVDAESERDPTDIGRRGAAAARAARPTTDAKQQAWEGLLEERPALALARSVAVAFQQPDQDELLAPWVARYPEMVRRVWQERSAEEAELLTLALYPRYDTGDAVLAMAAALIDDPALPDPARRLVREGRDGTLRAARARAADARGSVGAAVS